MFKELAPLLRHRAVLFTVTHVEEDQFRVNVIPKKVTEADNDALTTPVIRNKMTGSEATGSLIMKSESHRPADRL